jgi:hypothetical protein
LKVRRLQTTVGEVRRELELTLRGLASLLEASSFDLERKTNEILAADDNELLKL